MWKMFWNVVENMTCVISVSNWTIVLLTLSFKYPIIFSWSTSLIIASSNLYCPVTGKDELYELVCPPTYGSAYMYMYM